MTLPSRTDRHLGQGQGQPPSEWHPYPRRSVLSISNLEHSEGQTSRKCKDKAAMAGQSVATSERERVEIGAKGSLLFSCLAIQCHVLSIYRINVLSTV